MVQYYLLKTGKTWYQKWMDASPTYADDKRSLMRIRENLNHIVSMPYEAFLKGSHIRHSPCLNELYMDHKDAQTWRHLFESISSTASLKREFMQALPHIFKMLRLPNSVYTCWTIKKPDVLRLIAGSMTILLVDKIGNTGGYMPAQNKRHTSGQHTPDVLKELMYMYGGRFMQDVKKIPDFSNLHVTNILL